MDEKQLENLISEAVALREKGVPETEILDKIPAEFREELRGILNIVKNIRFSGANIRTPQGLTKRIIDNLPAVQNKKSPATNQFFSFLSNWKFLAPVGALAALVVVLATVKPKTNAPQYAKAPETQSPAQEHAGLPAQPAPAPQSTAQPYEKSQTIGGDAAEKPVAQAGPETAAISPAAAPTADSIIADFLTASFAEEALAADEEAAASEAGDPDGDADSFIDADGI